MPEPQRHFSLGDILSITTGHLLSPSGMAGIYRILNYMTGESVMTHQIPDAIEECRPVLVAAYPQLADLDTSEITRDTWADWLHGQVERFGQTLPVPTVTSRAPQYDTPVADLIEKVGDPTKVLIIEDPDAQC